MSLLDTQQADKTRLAVATAAVKRTEQLRKERWRKFWAVSYYAGVLLCWTVVIAAFFWSFRFVGPAGILLLGSSPTIQRHEYTVVLSVNVSRVCT
jgi:hypothetical protein